MKKMTKKKLPESSDLHIDTNNLEQEWVNQPALYYKYAVELAEARKDLDEAKSELDLVKAELDTVIRVDPEKYGVDRITEAAISNAVLQQQEYQDAVESYNKAHHSMRVLDAMVWALDHRKRALMKLVELHLANYYSEPKAPPRVEEFMEESVKASIRSKGRKGKKGG